MGELGEVGWRNCAGFVLSFFFKPGLSMLPLMFQTTHLPLLQPPDICIYVVGMLSS